MITHPARSRSLESVLHHVDRFDQAQVPIHATTHHRPGEQADDDQLFEAVQGGSKFRDESYPDSTNFIFVFNSIVFITIAPSDE